jgi:hypothetical protein
MQLRIMIRPRLLLLLLRWRWELLLRVPFIPVWLLLSIGGWWAARARTSSAIGARASMVERAAGIRMHGRGGRRRVGRRRLLWRLW